MPQPYDYTVAQPNVSTYFDAMREGRADRLDAETEQKKNALAKYLPDALGGNKDALAQVMVNATPEQQMQFHQMDAQRQAAHVEQIGAILATVKDQPSLDAAKAAYLRLPGSNPDEVQNITLQDVPALLAQSKRAQEILSQKFEQEYKTSTLANDTSRTQAQNALTAAQIYALKNKPVGGVDPNTGSRVAPAGLQNRDSGILTKARDQADAAANIAASLRSVLPSLKVVKTGPGTDTARNIGGVFSASGFFPSADEFTQNYDAIEQASKSIGIDFLQKFGGSDTQMELATAIKTTVNPNVRPEENMRRYRDQLGSAEILSRKADLMTQWVDKFGSLSYAAPNGKTWPAFWGEFQRAAWDDVQKQPLNYGFGGTPTGQPTGGNYRQEQRDLLNKGTQSGPVIPPGYERVK